MTLTFLILAGQVKVKGQLGEMAKCLEDSDRRIADLSRMFFAELSTKDNAVYNHFVDMFSLLSADRHLGEDELRRILKFLSTFIEKVKHILHSTVLGCHSYINCSRTNTRSSLPRNWPPGYRNANLSGNGTMLHTHSLYCSTKMMIFRLLWLADFVWYRQMLSRNMMHDVQLNKYSMA